MHRGVERENFFSRAFQFGEWWDGKYPVIGFTRGKKLVKLNISKLQILFPRSNNVVEQNVNSKRDGKCRKDAQSVERATVRSNVERVMDIVIIWNWAHRWIVTTIRSRFSNTLEDCQNKYRFQDDVTLVRRNVSLILFFDSFQMHKK